MKKQDVYEVECLTSEADIQKENGDCPPSGDCGPASSCSPWGGGDKN